MPRVAGVRTGELRSLLLRMGFVEMRHNDHWRFRHFGLRLWTKVSFGRNEIPAVQMGRIVTQQLQMTVAEFRAAWPETSPNGSPTPNTGTTDSGPIMIKSFIRQHRRKILFGLLILLVLFYSLGTGFAFFYRLLFTLALLVVIGYGWPGSTSAASTSASPGWAPGPRRRFSGRTNPAHQPRSPPQVLAGSDGRHRPGRARRPHRGPGQRPGAFLPHCDLPLPAGHLPHRPRPRHRPGPLRASSASAEPFSTTSPTPCSR